MEDSQPNEVRLARKGSTVIPRVRPTRLLHRGYPHPHDSRPFNRERGHRSPLPRIPIRRTEQPPERELVEVLLPQECAKGEPGWHNTRKRWVEDQAHYLSTNLHLSVLSFRYTDQSVLFSCRTPQAFQSTGHRAGDCKDTGLYPAKTHPDIRGVGITTQAVLLPSLVKPHDNHGDLAQSSEPGPSRIRLTPRAPAGSGGYLHHPDFQSSIPSSGCESKHVESHRVQTIHTSVVPRRRTAVHAVPPTEGIHNSTLSSESPVVQDRSGRWMSFRSGHVDICFPPSNNDTRPSSPEAPAQILDQRQQVSHVHFSDANISAQPSVHANDIVSVRSTGDCEMVGYSSRRPLRRDVLEAGGSNDSPGCPAALEDEIEVLPSPTDYCSLVGRFSNTSRELFLPSGPHDKPRRVLHNDIFTYVVTAHGIVDRINGTSVLKLDRNIRSPSSPFEEFVDDACILSHQEEPVIILGHAREQEQISLLKSGRGQVSQHITLRRDWNKRPGVSAIASLMDPLKFVSGGYDHRVHLWDIAPDLSGVSGVELAIEHGSAIHSLLPILDTSHKLVSVGADREVHIYDLSAERVMQTLKVSCTPYHAHKIDTPSCTLLEVSHLETQFEVRDRRKPYQAVQRFGYAAEDRRGRYEKADTWSHFVVCGDKNGAVHVWDLRNISKEVTTLQCLIDPVMQVVHTGPRLLACSKRNQIAYMDFQWT